MAKVTTTITDKKSGKIQNGELAPRPVLITPSNTRNYNTARTPLQKPKYTLLNQEGNIVATLIDQSLAEKWVADHKRGATRFVQGVQSQVV